MDLLLHDSPFSMSLSTRAPPVHRTRFADLDRTCVLVVPSLSGRCRSCGLNESRHRWPSSRLPCFAGPVHAHHHPLFAEKNTTLVLGLVLPRHQSHAIVIVRVVCFRSFGSSLS